MTSRSPAGSFKQIQNIYWLAHRTGYVPYAINVVIATTSIYWKMSICDADNERKSKIIGVQGAYHLTGPKFKLRILVTNLYAEFEFKMSICDGDNERKLKIIGIFFSPTRRLPVQARVAATEFKEFSQHKYLIQTIVKIMHKRMRFKLCRLNICWKYFRGIPIVS